MQVELKPCPFCGGEASVVQQQESKMWTVGCLDVDCPGGWLSRDRDLLYFDKDEAVERWNSRAERTCFADEVTHRDCKYSVNRGWRERTCRIESSYLNDFTSNHECWYEFEMQCGYQFTWDEMEPPTYCPNCGAKVIA